MFPIASLAELTSHPEVPTDAPALLDGTDSLSYGELDQLTGRLASALIGLGVGPGDRVGVYMRKSVWSFATVHAVLRAGAVMVPVDPFAPTAHVIAVLADAGARHLVTDARAKTSVEVAAAVELDGIVSRGSKPLDLPSDSRAVCVEWADLDGMASAGPVVREPEDDAYVIYTSGSTGRPKGIVHTHASALAYARIAASDYSITGSDRLTNIAGLHFDQSTFELYVAPLVGASVLVVPDAVLKFPASLSELAARLSVTVWYSVPYVLRHLVDRGALDQRDLSSIRLVLYGGEAYPPDELAGLMRELPGAVVSNVYGPAEVNQCTRHDLDAPPSAGRPIPIGGPWPQTHLLVVDGDGDPTDGVGELLVATPTMMDRYWNRPDLTAAAIVERRGSDGVDRRWYRTGDLVEPDADGALVFRGRVDNQVKIRGQRVELEAVDATVRSIDGVAEVACVLDHDDRGEPGVVAVIELEPGVIVAPADVVGVVRARHSAVAVPTRVVEVDRLERTGTGKVDRNAAQQHLGSGASR